MTISIQDDKDSDEGHKDHKGHEDNENKAGNDEGSLVVELLNYEGNNLEYHGFGTEPGVTVIARGTMYFGEQSEWRTMTVPIEDTGVSGLDITHLSVVFSSSKDGDKFVGEVGATLWVDNVVLNYEE